MKMRPSGIADLPLHTGKCPKWLFPLMKDLSGKITEVIVDEYGEKEYLKRLSDPYWFQALGSVIGFDWHSSGLTTTTTGALKESVNTLNLDIKIAGGKGLTSRKTPQDIVKLGSQLNLTSKQIEDYQKASRLTAKVDNSLIQDDYTLYHHTFIFTKKYWTVIQQGMSLPAAERNSTAERGSPHQEQVKLNGYARRYHWNSENIKSFTNDPKQNIISSDLKNPLNLIDENVEETRRISVDLINDNPKHLQKYFHNPKGQTSLFQFTNNSFSMVPQHFPKITANMKTLLKAYEQQPKNYEELISVKGMGQKNVRALALISHLVHGSELSWKDPVKYSFAHGGKDGWPYPVNREQFNNSISFLKNALNESKINNNQKLKALKRLNRYYQSKLEKAY